MVRLPRRIIGLHTARIVRSYHIRGQPVVAAEENTEQLAGEMGKGIDQGVDTDDRGGIRS